MGSINVQCVKWGLINKFSISNLVFPTLSFTQEYTCPLAPFLRKYQASFYTVDLQQYNLNTIFAEFSIYRNLVLHSWNKRVMKINE